MTHLMPQPSSNSPQKEQAPPYEASYNVADGERSRFATLTGEEKSQGNASPQTPFIYGGTIPASIRPKNMVLFGETGVGKSSVINLMAGTEVAKTSMNLEGCTLEATEYLFTLPGTTPFRIYDTVGLNEPEMGVNAFFDAIQKAHELITSLHNAGGVDFLLFCIRGGRITDMTQRNFRLFSEFLCAKQVPVAFIVTHLEWEDVMEEWWVKNEKTLHRYHMQPAEHACITAAQVTMFAKKKVESQRALESMLRKALGAPNAPYVREVRSWIASMIGWLLSFLGFEKRRLLKRLEDRCGCSRDEAEQLASLLSRS